jgi:hypothetical protein
MRLPVGLVELHADPPSDTQPQFSLRLQVLWLALVLSLVVGVIVLGSYLGRPKPHPEFYGDYRGGYARGLDLRAAGVVNGCEVDLRGPYASPKTWPAIEAKGFYLMGCWRGAKGKPIGDYQHRVDDTVNFD